MKRILFIATLAMTATIANAKAGPTDGKASFDYFSYSGNDDYYRQYPLTDKSAFFNPIIPGFHPDPALCRVGQDYWLVTSTFGYYPGVPLYHSRDLVNWTLVGNVLNRPSQLPALGGQEVGKGGIYAPNINYDPMTKTYYMLTTDVGRGHFYVSTKDPMANNWSDPVWLPAIDGIDPAFFFDDDGQAYIIYKESTEGKPKWSNHRSLRIARFDRNTGQTKGEPVKFSEEGVGPEERLARNEGPHIYKIKGKYYIIAAEGGTGNFHSEVAYRADSIFGPYTRWSRNPILTQRELKPNRSNPVTCTGHADIVQTPGGEWWAVFLGCRPGPGGVEQLGRETFMMPVSWSRDGFPYITQEKDTVPLTLRMEGAQRKAEVTFGNFTWRDDFDGERPGVAVAARPRHRLHSHGQRAAEPRPRRGSAARRAHAAHAAAPHTAPQVHRRDPPQVCPLPRRPGRHGRFQERAALLPLRPEARHGGSGAQRQGAQRHGDSHRQGGRRHKRHSAAHGMQRQQVLLQLLHRRGRHMADGCQGR